METTDAPAERMETRCGDGRPGPMTTSAGKKMAARTLEVRKPVDREDVGGGMDGTPPDDGFRRDHGRGWKDRDGVPAADGWRPPTPRPKG